MTTGIWLAKSTQKLTQAGVGTARLDALVLLEDVTGRDRAWLLAHPEQEISADELAKLDKLLTRRATHEPLAYVRGRTEFYGRDFKITPAVLEPRPESETMIDLLKKLPDLPPKPMVADIGTGCGAIGITAALELTNIEIDLLEIDPKAIKVAKMNVDKFTLSISVIKSDLLDAAAKQYDVLLCNLPYVPDDFRINRAASHEPAIAIFGGADGLDLYRRLFQQINTLKNKPLYILTESLPPQHAALADIATVADYRLLKVDDFIQVFKFA
jgi:release factor glutamine methyltransferase